RRRTNTSGFTPKNPSGGPRRMQSRMCCRGSTNKRSAAPRGDSDMPADSPSTATVTLNTEDVVGEVSPHLFGGFVEHLGRCVYEGIYDPTSPLADQRGFRKDVLSALREMKISVMRYPGGNFVSGYDWRDGVGPRHKRPR